LKGIVYDSRHKELMSMQVSIIENMRHYEMEFTDLYSSFIAHWTIYRQSCELLLSPLMLPESKLSELLESGDDKAWEDPEIRENLRKRLGRDYRAYELSVERLNRKLARFSKKLGLGKDMTVRI
jgi:hypothetical protein